MKRQVLISLLILLSTAGFAVSAPITVGLGGGYDFTTIQEAINAAVDGNEVVVADGVYTGVNNRDLDFAAGLPYGVTRAITVRSENGPENCIIDCQGQGRAFYFYSGETSSSVVEGFTIRNGFDLYYGGAIECENADPTISNCIIYDCSAYDGGAIDCYYADPTIIDCVIYNNDADGESGNGGGIECYNSSPAIINCLIYGNSAGLDGGAIDCYNSSPTIVSCTIIDNSTTYYSGGIYAGSSSFVSITNSIIWGNTALSGSEIYVDWTTSWASVSYSDVQFGWGGPGNIGDDPMFRTGPLGDYYLSQQPCQLADSDCVNNGSGLLSGLSLLGSAGYTTRTDSGADSGTIDMGYHYPDSGLANQFQLTTSVVGGNGSIDPAAGVHDISEFNEVLLTALPDTGFGVKEWLGTDDDSSLELTNTVTMTGNKSVSVEYRSLVVYELTTIVIGDHGSVTVSPPSIDPNTEYLYHEGELVQLTAVPDTGYVLRAWTGTVDDNSISTVNYVMMDSDKTVTAEFIPSTTMFHLDARVVGGNGTVSPRRGDYTFGTVVFLVAAPDASYRVKAWTGTNNDTSTSNNNAVTMTADKDVTVEFEPVPLYWLETLAVDNGEVVPDGITPDSGLVFDGTVVDLTAHPGPGLEVKRWYGTDDDTSDVNENQVTIDGSDAYVIVEFQSVGASMDPCTIKLYIGGTLEGTYPTIQFAIFDANFYIPTSPDDQNLPTPSVIVVADGVYSGPWNYDLNLRFGLPPNALRILTVRSEHGPQNCIIDCNGLGRAFIFDDNEDPNYIVDGFTITGGLADNGGAIYCGEETSPTITNCKIINNSTHLEYENNGGAIYCIDASPIIINTEISHNQAWKGGGIYCEATEGGESAPEIINCLFTYNHSLDAGGSIYLYESDDAEIHLCTVAFNTSDLYYELDDDDLPIYLGGIFAREADPDISNCIIWDNGDDLYECDATYSCIEDGDDGTGNIGIEVDDPLFVTGSFGDFYLSQILDGPTLVSPCVDAGEQYILLELQTDYDLGFDITTAITDLYDGGYADMGYHYRFNYGPPIRFKLKTFVDGGHGGICPAPLPVVHYYDPGTVVTLVATADPCYRVYQWTGTDNDYLYADFSTATMYSDRTVSIEFELIQPRTLVVSVGGGDPGFYVDIQDAVFDARTGDTVVVHAGTYYGHPIQVNKSIEIRSLHPDDPNYVAATIIERAEGYAEGGFEFIYETDAILNGFTIQNCGGTVYSGRNGARGSPRFHPNGEDGGFIEGGAIYIQAYASPTIKNCIIRDNYIEGGDAGDGVNATTTENAARGGWGGGAFGSGVYCDFYSSPTFINCRILDNEARGGDGGDGGDFNIDGGNANYGGNWSRAEFVYYDPDSLDAILVNGDLYEVFQADGRGDYLLWNSYFFYDPNDPDTWVPPAGYIRDYRWYSAYGGGVFCHEGSNVTFEDCEISGNRTYGGMSGIGGLRFGHRFEPWTSYELPTFGAGVYCAADSTVTFTGCTLTDNIASGVQLVDPNDPNSGTRFRQETYVGHGGGICAENTATVIIADCNFSENAASVGGGVHFSDANAVISDCDFVSNTAYQGGGLAGHQGEGIIINCEITNNRAAIDVNDIGLVYGQGGGLYLWDANVGVFDCDISYNESEASGGGVYIGGESGPLLSNCLIANNMCARDGGGVSANIFAWPMLFNCTITNNIVTGAGFSSYYGGGLYCSYNSNTTIINSILWGNMAFNGRQIAIGTGFEYDPAPSVVNVSFSDVQGGGAYVAAPATGGDTWVDETCSLVWDASSNLSGTSLSDPDFTSGYFGNYYLSHLATGQGSDSPCIDEGLGEANSLVLGRYRYTTRTDNGDDVYDIDIGYHYYKSGKFTNGDINYDGEINDDDLNILISYWLSECSFPGWCEGSDLNQDGIVDFIDLAILAALYDAGDIEAPVPNPSTWRLPPHSAGTDKIEMTATTAADNSGGPVEYYFECVTNSSFDSGWRYSPSYPAEGLPTGEYGFKVKARDTSPGQNETEWSHIGYAVTAPRDYYAVICGVANYNDPINDLSWTVNDAAKLYERLVHSANWNPQAVSSPENIIILSDSSAAKAEIQAAIGDMAANLDSQDVFVFYFSGHGTTGVDVFPFDEADGLDEYLVPYGTLFDPNGMLDLSGLIRDDELGDWLAALPTDNYIVLLDTCFSGGHAKGLLTPKGLGTNVPAEGDGFAEDLLRIGALVTEPEDVQDNGVGVVLAACDEDELSWEAGELEHGVFTYYLLEAMDGIADQQGNDNEWVSGEECHDYLAPRVSTYVQGFGAVQHPQLYDADLDNELEYLSLEPVSPGTPAAPKILLAGAVSSSQIDLAWLDDADNEDGFEIERRTGGGPFLQIDTVGPGTDWIEYSDTGLAEWTTYTYRVRAYNTAGYSSYSNEFYATTLGEGAPPVITSTAITDAEVGTLYTYDVDASGIPAPTYSLTTAPDGMTIDSVTGLISWMPDVTQVGLNAVTVQATNSEGSDTQSFDIDVDEPTGCYDDGLSPQPNPYFDANESYMGYDDINDVYFHHLESSIAEDAGDCEVEYFFQCYTNTGFNSSWQTSNVYQVDVSSYPVDYYWRVKARDPFRETPWSGFFMPD